MSISALKEDGTRVIGMLMNDSEWQEIEKLSKSRRLLMPQSTKVAIAKTRRGKLITRYFSHLPGEGDCARNNQGSIESIHHLHWKLEIYKALKEEGYDVMIECGNKAWVADVLVRFGDQRNPIAIEIQHSKQSAQETINRTRIRELSGVDTCWIFKLGASSGTMPHDFLSAVPIFYVEESDVKSAIEIAKRIVKGTAYFNSKTRFRKTPTKLIPIQIACGCGAKWLYPWAVALMLGQIDNNETNRVIFPWVKKGIKGHGRYPIPKMDEYDSLFEDLGRHYGLKLGLVTDSFVPNYSHCFNQAGARLRIPFPSRKNELYYRIFVCPNCRERKSYSPLFLPNQIINLDLERAYSPLEFYSDATAHAKTDPYWAIEKVKGSRGTSYSSVHWKRHFTNAVREFILQTE